MKEKKNIPFIKKKHQKSKTVDLEKLTERKKIKALCSKQYPVLVRQIRQACTKFWKLFFYLFISTVHVVKICTNCTYI
jgi:hypothetical protein